MLHTLTKLTSTLWKCVWGPIPVGVHEREKNTNLFTGLCNAAPTKTQNGTVLSCTEGEKMFLAFEEEEKSENGILTR